MMIKIDLQKADVTLLEAAMRDLGYLTQRLQGRFLTGNKDGVVVDLDLDRGWVILDRDAEWRTDEVRRAFALRVLRWAAELGEWDVLQGRGGDGHRVLRKLRAGSTVEVDILDDGTVEMMSARGDYPAINALFASIAWVMGGAHGGPAR